MFIDMKEIERIGGVKGGRNPDIAEGCGGQPTSRLEAGGVGSNYCSGCRGYIENQMNEQRSHEASMLPPNL